MDGVEFKELFKVAVETLREKTITPLLEADATYQEDSENEGIAEIHYLQLDLTEEQRKVCNRLLECRDKQSRPRRRRQRLRRQRHGHLSRLHSGQRRRHG